MDDVGRASINRLRRRGYIVESIVCKSIECKTALFKNVEIGMNKDIVKKNIEQQLESVPKWDNYYWLDKNSFKGIELEYENNILKSAEIREIYSSMLE